MDFVIGGVPRSGTTALARALDEHDDVFCWVSEVAFLVFASGLLKSLPVIDSQRAIVARQLRRLLTMVLVDLPKYHYETNGVEPAAHFDRAHIDEFCDAALDIFTSPQPRAEAMAACGQELRRLFRGCTSKTLVGEKTPGNVLVHAFDPGAARKWLFIHRDPFAAIRSMQARVGGDDWANVFDGPIETQIGIVASHGEHIIRSLRRSDANVHVVSYLDLLENLEGTLEGMCSFLEISTSESYFERVSQFVGAPVDRTAFQKFSDLDIFKISVLLREFMEYFRYDEAYFGTALGGREKGRAVEVPSSVVPLFGACQRGSSWVVDDRSSWVAYVPQTAQTLTAKISTVYWPVRRHLPPWALKSDGLWIEVSESSTFGELGEVVTCVTAKPVSEQVITIDLGRLSPVGEFRDGLVFRFDIRSALAITPASLIEASMDFVSQSFSLKSWTID